MTNYTFETCGAIDTANAKPVNITSYFKVDSNFSNIRTKNLYCYFKVANPSMHHKFYLKFYRFTNTGEEFLLDTVGPMETPNVGYGYWYWWPFYRYDIGGPRKYRFKIVDQYGNTKCSRDFYVGYYFRPGESFKIKTQISMLPLYDGWFENKYKTQPVALTLGQGTPVGWLGYIGAYAKGWLWGTLHAYSNLNTIYGGYPGYTYQKPDGSSMAIIANGNMLRFITPGEMSLSHALDIPTIQKNIIISSLGYPSATFRVEISYMHPYYGWYTYYFDILLHEGEIGEIIKTIILPSTWTPEDIAWFPVNITVKKDGNILVSETVNNACAIVKTNA